jgi:hypothetical protein
MLKTKPPKASLDPLRIFQHASRFHASDRRLRSTLDASKPHDIEMLAIPANVLSVFTSELYLKCLLCVETGIVPDTHNLKALFKRLQPVTRRALEDLWDMEVRLPHRQKVLDLIRTMPEGKNLRADLIYALDVGANSFIELRYFYEKNKAFFLLDEFPNMLRKVILNRFPAWGTRPDTTSPLEVLGDPLIERR